ncbi:MAG: hypothetical protein CFE24_08105 [Flavobacterium sp. BFFFF2]|nr:MAG: hypothetical protein CFE24_08105 [Flavobacterium sp. BFFFF2]
MISNSIYSKQEFDLQVEKLENGNVYKSKSYDTISFYVPNFKFTEIKRKFATPNLLDEKLHLNYVLNNDNKTCFFVLRNKKGNYFNSKGITEIKEFAKKEDWKFIGNGYSKGAFVDYNSRRITYWLIVW